MPTPPLHLVHDDVRPSQAEAPSHHLRNALHVLRWVMDTSQTFPLPEGYCVVVPMHVLDAVAKRLESAIEALEGVRVLGCVVAALVLAAASPLVGQVEPIVGLRQGRIETNVSWGAAWPVRVTVALHERTVVNGRVELGRQIHALISPDTFNLRCCGDRQTVRIAVRESVAGHSTLGLVWTFTPIEEPQPTDTTRTTARLVVQHRFIAKVLVEP